MNINAAILNSVPANEKKIPTPKAFIASPFKVKGYPSKHVATDEGVPGIWSRIAEISPPDTPPI